MIPNIGPLEIVVVLIIALVVFGPKRIPELGSSLGRGINGFKKGIDGKDEPAAVPAATGANHSTQGSEHVDS
ncbi:MAG: Sec-independent protein translocase subunit TatA/TatB [Solirubrobacterales bacterium]